MTFSLLRTLLINQDRFLSSNEPDSSLNTEGRSHSFIPLLADDDTDVNELRECSANKEVRPSGRKKGLKMASLNVNGLLSKIDEVRQLAKNEKIDIFAINETKIDDKVKDQLVDIDKFDLKRSDMDRHRDGDALYIRTLRLGRCSLATIL